VLERNLLSSLETPLFGGEEVAGGWRSPRRLPRSSVGRQYLCFYREKGRRVIREKKGRGLYRYPGSECKPLHGGRRDSQEDSGIETPKRGENRAILEGDQEVEQSRKRIHTNRHLFTLEGGTPFEGVSEAKNERKKICAPVETRRGRGDLQGKGRELPPVELRDHTEHKTVLTKGERISI